MPFQKSSPPRYLPTLTEVVESSTARPAPPESAGADALADRVLDQLQPAFAQELDKLAHELLDKQLAALMPVLQQALEERVRQAVLRALAESGQGG